MSRRLIPYSLLFFAALALILALQWVPIVNIALFATQSLYPMILGNAGLIGLAVEATIGRLARLWLLVPLSVYGVYYTYALPEQFEASRLQNVRAASNVDTRVSFDPDGHSLVIGGSIRSEMLVREYGLPVAYEIESQGPEKNRSVRYFGRNACLSLSTKFPLDTERVSLQWLSADGAGVADPHQGTGCIFKMPESAPKALLRVVASPGRNEAVSFDASSHDVELTSADGQHYRLRAGIARPLPWIPSVTIWCGPPLTDSDKLQPICQINVNREGDERGWIFAQAEVDSTRALARALGLESMSHPKHDRDRVLASVSLQLNKFLEANAAKDFARLDAAIADLNHKPPTTSGLEGLSAFPVSLAKRSEGLIQMLEHDLRNGDQNEQRDYVSAELIAALPGQQFRRLGPRLLALYQGLKKEAGAGHRLWRSYKLIGRLGDLGPGALPILASSQNTDIFYGHGSVEGFCRVGIAGRAVAEPILAKAWKQDPGGNDLFNLAVATRRIGIPLPPVSNFRRQKDGTALAKAAEVTPTSPPSVCTLATDQLEAEELNERAVRKAEFFRRNNQGS